MGPSLANTESCHNKMSLNVYLKSFTDGRVGNVLSAYASLMVSQSYTEKFEDLRSAFPVF